MRPIRCPLHRLVPKGHGHCIVIRSISPITPSIASRWERDQLCSAQIVRGCFVERYDLDDTVCDTLRAPHISFDVVSPSNTERDSVPHHPPITPFSESRFHSADSRCFPSSSDDDTPELIPCEVSPDPHTTDSAQEALRAATEHHKVT